MTQIKAAIQSQAYPGPGLPVTPRPELIFRKAEKCLSLIIFALPGTSTMPLRVRKFAHVLERIGLAMAGASSGLFVGSHVGSSIASLTSQGFLLAMMIAGAVGFYLGIDTPALVFAGPNGTSPKTGFGGRIDTAELLSAVGTFLATLAAFLSVAVIVLRENPHDFWTIAILLAWVFGVMMQITAGAIARTRTR